MKSSTLPQLLTALVLVQGAASQPTSNSTSRETATGAPSRESEVANVPEDLRQYLDQYPPDVITGKRDWLDIATRKRAERDALLPQEWKIRRPDGDAPYSSRELVLNSGLLTPEELDLTDTARYDLTETARRIAERQVTAEQVVTAFCNRATAATSLANFMTEINFNGAMDRARELDRILRDTGRTVGPLHGVPITIKDAHDLAGFATSEGLTPRADNIARENGAIVQIMIDAGAVVIGKTNMPQSGLAADSNNILFGRTLNAHNSQLGAGGSTGGEGAALGTGSSLFGVGSDGAGSCRMPAHANGVIGYRASGYRLPEGSTIGAWTSGRSGLAMTGPVAGNGFFAHSVRDLRLVARLTAEANASEINNIFQYPTPWLGVEAPSPAEMTLGAWQFDEDTFITPFPPVLRGYNTAVERLRSAGVNIVPFKPPRMSRVWDLCKDFLDYQGIEAVVEEISKEPVTKICRDTGVIIPTRPRFPKGVETLYNLNNELLNLSSTVDAAWSAGGRPIDALLSVTAANTALPFDQWHDTGYTSLWNSVDFPAVNLPLGMTADKAIDLKDPNFKPLSNEDRRLEALYDPDLMHGLPLSVQLVTRKFQDEKLLAYAEKLHPILKGETLLLT